MPRLPTTESEPHPPPAPHAHHPPQHSSITTTITAIPSLSPSEFARVLKNIQVLLWAPETLFPDASDSSIPEVLRLKGIVWNSEEGKDEDRIRGWVIQGVRGVYEVEEIKSGDKEEGGQGKIVVVGRALEGVGASLWEPEKV